MKQRYADNNYCQSGVHALVCFAILVAGFSIALSVLSIVYQLNHLTIGIAALLAIFLSVAAVRRFPKFALVSVAQWFVVAAPFLVVSAMMAVAPPYTWDEVAYSAALPKQYVVLGRVTYIDEFGPYSAFPAYYEVITTAALKLFGSITPVRILGLVLFLAFAAVAGILASMISRWPTTSTILATVLVLSAEIIVYCTYVKGDFANAYFQIFTVLAIAQYLRLPRIRWMVLAGMALGFSVGIKYNSIQFAVCVAALSVPFCFAARWPNRRAAWGDLVVFALVTVIVCAPWYVRNLADHGNPFFPFFANIFDRGSDTTPIYAAMVREMFYGNFSYKSSTFPVLYQAVVAEFGVVVAILGSVGVFSIAVFAWSKPKEYIIAIFLIAITALYSAVIYRFGVWAPRYFIVLLGLYAVFATASIVMATERIGRWLNQRRLVPLVAVAATAVLMYSAITRQWSESRWLIATVWADRSNRTFISQAVNYWAVANWLNANLSENDRVGIGIDVQPFFYLDRRYYNIHPLQEIFLTASSRTDYYERFRKLGLTHLAAQEWIGQSNYSEATNPTLYRFIHSFEAAIVDLERSHQIEQVGEVDGLRGKKVRFYKLIVVP